MQAARDNNLLSILGNKMVSLPSIKKYVDNKYRLDIRNLNYLNEIFSSIEKKFSKKFVSMGFSKNQQGVIEYHGFQNPTDKDMLIRLADIITLTDNGQITAGIRTYNLDPRCSDKKYKWVSQKFQGNHFSLYQKDTTLANQRGAQQTRNIRDVRISTVINKKVEDNFMEEVASRQQYYTEIHQAATGIAVDYFTYIMSIIFTTKEAFDIITIKQDLQEIHSKEYIRYSVAWDSSTEEFYVKHYDGNVDLANKNTPPNRPNIEQIGGLQSDTFLQTNAQKYQYFYQFSFQSFFPIQPVGFNYAFSDEPILLNGMKVLFDNPTPTTPVTLQPKQRGINNGR